MRLEISRSTCPWAIAAVAAAVLSFAGCGGGGGSSGTTTQPANQSVSGVVIDGPIQGATVCLDLNKNGACDAGEPTSTSTDAQGNYTIGGLTADQVNSGAPLIAVIPATAIDASNPGVAIGTAYTLTAPAGKGAVISPITTLVQTGVAQGMTQAEAEAAVAAQLQVAATSLYNNYVASSSGDNAALVAVVPTIVSSLQAGETLVVSAPVASAPNYWARQLDFTDTSNYYLRYYYTPNVPDSNGTYTYYDERIKLSNGSPVASSSLYDTALYATASGWKSFNGATPNTSTGGSPSVSTWGYGYVYSSTRVETDVSGMPISEVVAMAQNTTVNTFSTINGVNASALTGTMPAGAKIRKHTGVSTATPVAYRVSDGYVGSGVTTLAGLVAAFPGSGNTDGVEHRLDGLATQQHDLRRHDLVCPGAAARRLRSQQRGHLLPVRHQQHRRTDQLRRHRHRHLRPRHRRRRQHADHEVRRPAGRDQRADLHPRVCRAQRPCLLRLAAQVGQLDDDPPEQGGVRSTGCAAGHRGADLQRLALGLCGHLERELHGLGRGLVQRRGHRRGRTRQRLVHLDRPGRQLRCQRLGDIDRCRELHRQRRDQQRRDLQRIVHHDDGIGQLVSSVERIQRKLDGDQAVVSR
jgi:hypothetical protein